MNFKSLSIVLVTTLSLSMMTACSDPSSSPAAGIGGPQGQSCSLQDTWSQCSDNGDGTSGRVRLTFSGSSLYETIDNYNSSDCTGTTTGQFAINATVTVGGVGQSTAIVGGTDVDLVPDLDFAGCGSGQPVYTVIKFNDSCDQFQIPDTQPSCNPASRGSSLSAGTFTKE